VCSVEMLLALWFCLLGHARTDVFTCSSYTVWVEARVLLNASSQHVHFLLACIASCCRHFGSVDRLVLLPGFVAWIGLHAFAAGSCLPFGATACIICCDLLHVVEG
jgi:hypothetical protein